MTRVVIKQDYPLTTAALLHFLKEPCFGASLESDDGRGDEGVTDAENGTRHCRRAAT